MQNFMKIGRTVAKIWRFNGFSKWRPSAFLDFQKFEFMWVPFRGSICVTIQNFVAIGEIVAMAQCLSLCLSDAEPIVK